MSRANAVSSSLAANGRRNKFSSWTEMERVLQLLTAPPPPVNTYNLNHPSCQTYTNVPIKSKASLHLLLLCFGFLTLCGGRWDGPARAWSSTQWDILTRHRCPVTARAVRARTAFLSCSSEVKTRALLSEIDSEETALC